MPDPPAGPDPDTRARWLWRYAAALRRLREAGIETASDEPAGAERYVELRARWDRYVAALAPTMAFDPAEIDPAAAEVGVLDSRPEPRPRPRPVG